jgi:hypothetical protein
MGELDRCLIEKVIITVLVTYYVCIHDGKEVRIQRPKQKVRGSGGWCCSLPSSLEVFGWEC